MERLVEGPGTLPEDLELPAQPMIHTPPSGVDGTIRQKHGMPQSEVETPTLPLVCTRPSGVDGRIRHKNWVPPSGVDFGIRQKQALPQSEVETRTLPLVGARPSGVDGRIRHKILGATVGGGKYNLAQLGFSTVGGGWHNEAQGHSSTVGGGYSNEAQGHSSTVGGGRWNQAKEWYATVGGGFSNEAQGWLSTVGGGFSNEAEGENATVGGGWGNEAQAYYSTVGGGRYNDAEAEYSTVGGGDYNQAEAEYATVGGGYKNQAGGPYSSIPGGDGLRAQSWAQTVLGGFNVPKGSVPIRYNGDHDKNEPIVIVGNGENDSTRSNAFEVSYNGHAIVFDQNMSGTARGAVKGGTYIDNIVYGWAEVNVVAGEITSCGDFGVRSISRYGPGIYRVTLNLVGPDGAEEAYLNCGAIVATLGTGITPGKEPVLPGSYGCAQIVTSDIVNNVFDVFILQKDAQSGHCDIGVDMPFKFHVTGRVTDTAQ